MRLTIYEKEGRPCFLYLLDTNLWKNWKRTCSDSTSRVRDWRFPGLSNSLAFSGSSSSARMEMKRLASSFNLWISASTSYNFHDSSWHGSRLSKVQKSSPNKKKCIQILTQTLQTQTLALQRWQFCYQKNSAQKNSWGQLFLTVIVKKFQIYMAKSQMFYAYNFDDFFLKCMDIYRMDF